MSYKKFLGIDFGTKRIGIAISDDNGRLAFPKEILKNDENIYQKISEILQKEKISEIVVGESVDFKGKLNALSARIDIFILEIENKFGIPVRKQKEFLTSVEARKGILQKGSYNKSQSHNRIKQIKSGRIDSSAAALILQRYLDKINK